jgi:hypothetical protein
VEVRTIPAEFELQTVPGDGSCLFAALAGAIGDATGKKKAPPARQVRAEVVHSMRKHDEYAQLWDGFKLDGTTKAANFEEYLTEMEHSTAKGGTLEIRAAANKWRVQIYVLCKTGDEDGYLYYDVENAKHKIFLWYDGAHFDWLKLKPDQTPSATTLACRARPPKSGLRGGGDVDAVSSCSAFTFMSATAASSAATLGIETDCSDFTFTSKRRRITSKRPPVPGEFCSARATATGDETDLDIDVEEHVGEAVPEQKLGSCNGYERGGWGSHVTGFTTVDNMTRWTCPYCPYVAETRGVNKEANKTVSQRKSNHLQRHHPDKMKEVIAERKARRKVEITWSKKGEIDETDVFWACPLCDAVIVRDRATSSSVKLSTARAAHGRVVHGLSTDAWKSATAPSLWNAAKRRGRSVLYASYAAASKIAESTRIKHHILEQVSYPVWCQKKSPYICRRW